MTTAALNTVPIDRPIHITRSLLGYGVIAGPIYPVASLIQAVRGDLLAKLGRTAESRQEFARAAQLTRNERERAIFQSRATRS